MAPSISSIEGAFLFILKKSAQISLNKPSIFFSFFEQLQYLIS